MTAKEKIYAGYEGKIAAINTAIRENTGDSIEKMLVDLGAIEKEYKKLIELELYRGTEDVVELLRTHEFVSIHHKKITEEGVTVGVEKADRVCKVNPKLYCETRGLPIAWWYNLQALNKRLTMAVAISLAVKPDELRTIDSSYQMDTLAREIELGKTPYSKTQIEKHIQSVFDDLVPGNTCKIVAHDVAFVMNAYTKSSRTALKIQCSQHSKLMDILTDCFHRNIVSGFYSVDCKLERSSAPATDPAPETPASEAPTEAVPTESTEAAE